MLNFIFLLILQDVSAFNETVNGRMVIMDRAWLFIDKANFGSKKVFYHQRECYKCLWTELKFDRASSDDKPAGFADPYEAQIDIRWPLRLAIAHESVSKMNYDDETTPFCIMPFEKFAEGGFYELTGDCKRSIIMPGRSQAVYLYPVYTLVLVVCIPSIIYLIWYNIRRRRALEPEEAKPENPFSDDQTDTQEDQEVQEVEPAPPVPAKKKRYKSLDTLRGLSLIIMIFVNYGGGEYWFMEHVAWNGLTLADLVMPWFLFMSGVSIRIALQSRIKRGISKTEISYEILVRSVKLIGLGMITIGGNESWEYFRFPGVLQRIGFSYFVVAIIHLLVIEHPDKEPETNWGLFKRYFPEHLISWSILGAFICLTYFLPVPGCPTGYTGPGGLSENGEHYDCIGGAAGYIDRKLLGEKHIYNWPTAYDVYYRPEDEPNGVPFDPEGLVGTLTSIFMVYLGLQAGKCFDIFKTPKSIILHLLGLAAVYGISGMLLATIGLEYDDRFGKIAEAIIPINKNLWSVSFVFVLSSMAFTLLAFLYFIIDVRDWWDGAPCYFVGMNSILIYLLHSIAGYRIPFTWTPKFQSHSEEMLMAFMGPFLWTIYAYWCYDRKFFVSV